MRIFSLAILGFLLLPSPLIGQAAPEWHDNLVDHMAGQWSMEGRVLGREAHHQVQADWILNHQFLRIHEETSATAPAGEHRYEAFWFLGYDSIRQQYVLHLMDVYGARYSETLGYGTRTGDELRFVFDYPDGPFRTTYKWDSAIGTWQWIMKQKGKDGKWTPFADLKLSKVTP